MCSVNAFTYTTITRIEELSQEDVWDFSVPEYENYLMAGVVHHNSLKTTNAIVKAIMIYTGIIPPALRGLYPHKIPINRPRHVRIVVGDYSKSFPETIIPMLIGDQFGMLPRAWSQDWDPTEHIWYGPDLRDAEPRTGSWLSIVAIDPSKDMPPKVLYGANIDHTMIDEITRRDVYTECIVRPAANLDGPRTVDYVFCPQEGKDVWDYKDIYGACYDLRTDERLPEEKQHPDINCLRVSMKDNPLITPQTIEEMVSRLKPWEVAYRVNGLYSDRAENPFFNMDILWAWERKKRMESGKAMRLKVDEIDPENGIFKGHLEASNSNDIQGDEELWRVWEECKKGEFYLCTQDTSEGKSASDFHCVDIWRCSEDGKLNIGKCAQVAQYWKRSVTPDVVTEQALCMATLYGKCLYVFERNSTCGGIVLSKARYYDNVYKRHAPNRINIDETEIVGWYTEKWNKPAALQEAYRMIDEWHKRYADFCGIRSEATLNDMISFEDRIEKDKNGTNVRVLAARRGAHDDCVTALFIMAYITRFQKDLLTPATDLVENSARRRDTYKGLGASNMAKRENTHFPKLKSRPSLRDIVAKRSGRPNIRI